MWTCSGSGSAVCHNAAGSSNLSETVDLPGGGSLHYELTATVLALEGTIFNNTATIEHSPGLTYIDPGNNSATDSDPLGVFDDGFKSE